MIERFKGVFRCYGVKVFGLKEHKHPDTLTLKHSNTVSLILAACLCATTVAGCSMAPRVQQPEAAQTMPDRFDQATADDPRAQPVWWQGFNDPVLDQLVDTALVRNLDLRVAVARVKEVQSQYRIARAPWLPSVQATLDRNQQSTPANTGLGSQLGGDGDDGGPPGGFAFPDRFEFTTYSASLGFSYELDFWGRVRGSKDAALREFFASQADLQTAQIGVIAETISTYFEIAELERTLALTRQDVDLLAERFELTQQRYERGLISSFELYAIQQVFENARSSRPLLESQLAETRRERCVWGPGCKQPAAVGERRRRSAFELRFPRSNARPHSRSRLQQPAGRARSDLSIRRRQRQDCS